MYIVWSEQSVNHVLASTLAPLHSSDAFHHTAHRDRRLLVRRSRLLSDERFEGGRSIILLSPGERDLVLAEMRTFLQSVQRITQALTTDDMTEAAKAAREVGAAAADGVPISLMAKLPIGFKKLGLSTHRAFDQLALDAEQLGDPAHTLSQLAALQVNCLGCHSAFRIQAD